MKSTKKLLKSGVVALAGTSTISSLLSRVGRNHIPVFMLHRFQCSDRGIEGHSPADICSALEYLRKEQYSIIPLEDAVRSIRDAVCLPTRCVSFTIDDGYVEQADIGGPLFARYDCPVTFFVTTGFVDGELWLWDSRLKYILAHGSRQARAVWLGDREFAVDLSDELTRRSCQVQMLEWLVDLPIEDTEKALDKLALALEVVVPGQPPQELSAMSWAQARGLEEMGMQIGPHTVSHCTLSRVDAYRARDEIFRSWARVKEMVANPSPIFCYPSGRESDYSQREVGWAYAAGLLGAVTATPGYLPSGASLDALFRIRRFAMPSDLADFVQYASAVEFMKEVFRGGAYGEGGEVIGY